MAADFADDLSVELFKLNKRCFGQMLFTGVLGNFAPHKIAVVASQFQKDMLVVLEFI